MTIVPSCFDIESHGKRIGLCVRLVISGLAVGALLSSSHTRAAAPVTQRSLQEYEYHDRGDLPAGNPNAAMAAQCPAVPQGTISAAGGSWSGDTTGLANDFEDDYPAGTGSYGSGGADEIHTFQVDASGVWQFDTSMACWDTSIGLRVDTAGCPGDAVEFDGDSLSDCYYESLLSVFLVTGTDYYLVVDGWTTGTEGPYNVNYVMTLAACADDAACSDGDPCNGEETCNTGNGQCEAGTPPCDRAQTCTPDPLRGVTCTDPDSCLIYQNTGVGGWSSLSGGTEGTLVADDWGFATGDLGRTLDEYSTMSVGNAGPYIVATTLWPHGLNCVGGSTDGAECDVDGDCTGFLCVGGVNDGLACVTTNPDCPGECDTSGDPCFADADCTPSDPDECILSDCPADGTCDDTGFFPPAPGRQRPGRAEIPGTLCVFTNIPSGYYTTLTCEPGSGAVMPAEGAWQVMGFVNTGGAAGPALAGQTPEIGTSTDVFAWDQGSNGASWARHFLGGGDLSNWVGELCTEPVGPCCLSDCSCTIQTQADCEGVGGVYLGDNNAANGLECVCTCAAPPLPAQYPHDRRKNRYISFDPNNAENDGNNVAFKIELKSITLGSCSGPTGGPVDFCRPDRGPDDCNACSVAGNACIDQPIDCAPVPPQTCDPTGETCVNDAPDAGGTNVGQVWWVGCESRAGNGVHLMVSEPFRKASTNWPNPTHVGDCEVVPQGVYGVRAVDVATGLESDELEVETTLFAPISSSWWADCVGPLKKFCGGDIRNPVCALDGDCTAPETCDRAWTLPDGSVNFDDVNAALALVAPGPTSVAPDPTWVDLHGNASGAPGSQNFDPPNFVLNFSDIGQIISGFGGFPYKGYDPKDCGESWPQWDCHPDGGGGGVPARMPYGGKFRRVDIHGVPMPDRSPTGEGEDDRLPNMAYIDMYDLAPLYSVTDVAVPVEGGELTLEFRRTSGIRSFRHSTDVRNQGITYPSDSILGLGWDTNLASRAIVVFDPNEEDPTKNTTARVTDEVGTSYPYFDTGQTGEGSPFTPDVVHSFVNDSVRAKLLRQDTNTLVLVKVFGTRLTYEKVGRFTPPDPTNSDRWEDYYRLAHIEDRNGNRLEYVYTTSDPNSRSSFLVAEIHEAAHPERRLQFSYTLGTGLNGVDRLDRLNKVTDPLGRETSFSFLPSDGNSWKLLLEVKRESVPDAEDGGAIAQPTIAFSYHAVELPVEETDMPPSLPLPDPTTKNRYVAPSSITDARGHVTTFSYIADFFPTTFTQDGRTFYQQKIRLTGASTVDGPVVLTQEVRTGERVITKSQDTHGNTARYDFVAQRLPADNKFGVAIYVTQLTRTSEALPSDNTAVFQWTPDAFANLIHVTDMNGNTIDYTYGNVASQQSNQPTLRTITDTGNSETIATNYEYGAFNKMTRLVGGEGKETTYTLDANGNRTHINEELGKTTIYQYASDGFVEKITDPDERMTTFSRTFTPADLTRHYELISTVTGYSGELILDTETVSDVKGNKVEMSDPQENVYKYEYDALYRRTRTTNPAVEESPGGALVTSTMEYTYNLNSSVIEEKDDLGNVTISVFDLMNRVSETRRRMTDPTSNDNATDLFTTNTYNPVGLVDTTTDPNGNVTVVEYDPLLRLSRKTFDANVLAYVETYEYGNNAGSGAFTYTTGWQPTRVINRRGFAQDTTYDGFYRTVTSISRQTNGVGISHDDPPAANEPTTYMTYNKVHNEITVTVLAEQGAGGDRTTYTFYDDLHRPTISLLDFDGEEGGDGNDGAPYTIYVNESFLFAAHDAEDFVTRTAYDKAGNITTVIDAEGNATDTEFDGASRVIRVEQPDVELGDPPQYIRPTTTAVFNDNNKKILVEDPNGNRIQMVYDARNRLTRSIRDLNGDGQFDLIGPDIVTDTHYDLTDNIIRVKDPNGNETDTEYDRAYRVNLVRGPPVADAENGEQMTRPVVTSQYNKNSNVTSVTDPRLVKTRSTYDGLDRVLTVTKAFDTADAVTTTTRYDPNDNVLELELDNGSDGLQTTVFTFDPIDRQVTETWPGGNLTASVYYRNSLLSIATDPKGQKIESDYDRADRIVTTRRKRADDSIEETRTFTYDKMDNALAITDLNGTSIHTYDAIYRVITEQRSDVGESAYTVTNAYDLNSNRTTCTYPQTNRTLTSTFDRLDRLSDVIDSVGGKTTTYTYDANSNRLSCSLPNGVVDTFTYDALNRILTHVSQAGGPHIYNAAYTYDLANQRRTITETVQGHATRSLVYGYDDQYRLTSENWAGNSYSYAYDPAGNRLTKTINAVTRSYTYNVRNELLTETTAGVTKTYSHDANGNRSQEAVSGGSTTDYLWDVNDRLIEAKVDSATVFEASYDYRTRRLTKTESATATYFRYDGGVSFHELTGGITPAIKVEFIRGSGMGGGIGSILYSDRSTAGGSDEYFCYNAVGHTVAISDSTSVVVKSDLYEAFGNVVNTFGASLNNRLANTKERDSSISFHYHGFRYYDSSSGRYINRDPAQYIDGLNVYTYVNNNPINQYDPEGLFWGWASAAVGAAIGAVVNVAVTVASNALTGKDLSDGVGAAALEGAVAGGIAGGLMSGDPSVYMAVAIGAGSAAAGSIAGQLVSDEKFSVGELIADAAIGAVTLGLGQKFAKPGIDAAKKAAAKEAEKLAQKAYVRMMKETNAKVRGELEEAATKMADELQDKLAKKIFKKNMLTLTGHDVVGDFGQAVADEIISPEGTQSSAPKYDIVLVD